MLKKIVELVQGGRHLVLATCADGLPHASLMAYAAAADCREFWVATLKDSRKYRNLEANPRASLLIDDRGGEAGKDAAPGLALGVEVERKMFSTPEEAAKARAALLGLHPNLLEFNASSNFEVLRLVALRAQLVSGVDEVIFVDMEKVLDAQPLKA